jgi:HNH endonuclease/AP2 domain
MITEIPLVQIPLTRGMFTIVDAADLPFVSSFKWCAQPVGQGRFYVSTRRNNKLLLLHRVLLRAAEDQWVDHINHDPLDNRRSNIRLCSKQENAINKTKQLGCHLSQYKGVAYAAYLNKKNPWMAFISKNKKRTHLGYFPTELEAAQAYNQAALHLHKEFACLNPLN